MKKYAFSLLTALILIFLVLFILKYKTSSQKILSPESLNPDAAFEFTLVSTGDVGLVRTINQKIQQKKNPNYPFMEIADYLRDADFTITNVEGALIKNCPIFMEGFILCGEDSNVIGLNFAGVDAANLANNHTTNFGLSGLNETVKALEKDGISAFGLDDQIKYVDIKGKRVALVGFVELGNNWAGLNNAKIENVKNLNQEAKQNADIVIDAFHWGVEYTTHPTSNQVLLAHAAIDSGADIVLGNHPHWIQDYEVFKGKPIVYAQGNTIFDQDWSQETKEGVLYKFVYRNGRFEKIDERFTIIENNAVPRFATEEETKRIKLRLVQ